MFYWFMPSAIICDALSLFVSTIFIHKLFQLQLSLPSIRRLSVYVTLFLPLSVFFSYFLSLEVVPRLLFLFLYLSYHILLLLFPFFLIPKESRTKTHLIVLLLTKVVFAILAQTICYLLPLSSGDPYLALTAEKLSEILVYCAFLIYFLVALQKKTFNANLTLIPIHIFVLIVVILFFVGLLESHTFSLDSAITFDSFFPKVILLLIMSLLILMIVRLLQVSQSKHFSEYSLALMEKQVQQQIAHYQTLKQHEEEMHLFRHDYKNLVMCLTALLKADNCKEALEFINGLQDIFPENKLQYDTGNYLVDALFSIKNASAKEHDAQIQFEGFIPTMKIDNVDLCIVLTNVLDNAIEACAKLPGMKTIQIQSDIRNHFWVFRATNPVLEDVSINASNQTVVSTKLTGLHGFGLNNIRRIVNKYHGKVCLSCEEKQFMLEAILSMSDASASS